MNPTTPNSAGTRTGTVSTGRRRAAKLALAVGLLAGALPVTSGAAAPSSRVAPAAAPTLSVTTAVSGLDHPWDIAFGPHGRMFWTQRERGSVMVRDGRGTRTLVARVPHLWVSGETGLMGIALHPNFSSNRRFYTCNGHTEPDGSHDVRVIAWRANDAITSASRIRPLVTGIEVSSGRHGGCRLRFGSGGGLFIGTGDAALTGNSRNLGSLGGKVLRVDPLTGAPHPGNPFVRSSNRKTRLILTYGHRNIQGLALRADGIMWSVEHGPDRDDEVNILRKGGDYGWEPGPGYDESVPMTDNSLPGVQIDARWSSGFPTVATSGATWLRGNRWDSWEGALAVAALKDQSLRIMRFNAAGILVGVARPGALAGTYGRLRAAQMGPNGVLYLTTDNGSGQDRILAVRAG